MPGSATYTHVTLYGAYLHTAGLPQNCQPYPGGGMVPGTWAGLPETSPPIDLPIAFTQVAVLDTRTRFYIYSYHVWQNSVSAPVKPTECLHNH